MSNFKSAVSYQIIVPDVGSSVVDISDAVSPYLYHIALDGNGSPPVQRRFETFANSDGGVDQGYQLDAREMVYTLMLYPIDANADEGDLQAQRMYLVDALKPDLLPYKLKVTRGDGEVRQIDFHVNGAVDFRQSGQVGLSNRITIPMYCPEPNWYNPTQSSEAAITSFSAGSATGALAYQGNAIERPTIEIGSGYVDLVLYINASVGATTHHTGKFDFTGYTTPGADKVIVNLSEKTITLDSTGADLSGNIVNTDWVDAYLGPKWYDQAGASTISMYATYTSHTSGAITFLWNDRYLHL